MGGKLIYSLTRRTQRTLRRKEKLNLCVFAPFAFFALKKSVIQLLSYSVIQLFSYSVIQLFSYSVIKNIIL